MATILPKPRQDTKYLIIIDPNETKEIIVEDFYFTTDTKTGRCILEGNVKQILYKQKEKSDKIDQIRIKLTELLQLTN